MSKQSKDLENTLSYNQIRKCYVEKGMTPSKIASMYNVDEKSVNSLIKTYKLDKVRTEYIKDGLSEIQATQIDQAKKLLNLELEFKKLRIAQLENQLQDFVDYYDVHGDFYKRHPISNEIIKDNDGIPLQLRIPNIGKELNTLKESVTLSEGMKTLLARIDDIINSPQRNGELEAPNTSNDDVIDMDKYDDLFKKR